MAGVNVTFAVTAGGGSITPASVVTGNDGVARASSWTLGTTPGLNTVSATAGSLPPVIFSATAQDPCTLSATHTLGTTTTGELRTIDCRLSTGEFVDFYTLNLSAASAIAINQRSTAFDTYLVFATAAGRPIAENDDSASANLNSYVKALLPAGNYSIGASSFATNATGNYTLTSATVSADITGCEDVFIVKGVSTSQSLQASDCALSDGSFADGVYIFLQANESVTISMSSTSVDAYLYLLNFSGTTVAENDDANASTNDAQIVYTAPSSGFYIIVANSFGPGEVGPYTLIVQ